MKITSLGAAGALVASSMLVGLAAAPSAGAASGTLTNGTETLTGFSSPYEYYTSAPGVPQGDQGTITGTGFIPGQNVFIETCDGVNPATTANYNPNAHCFDGNAQVQASLTGTVTIKTSNPNYQWRPYHGEDPLDSFFNCLAPTDDPNGTTTVVGNQPIDNTYPSWGANTVGAAGGGKAPCQIRVYQLPGTYQASDFYIPITGLDQSNPMSTGPAAPEAPLAVLLPLGAVVLLAGGAAVTRRRRHRVAA